MARVKIDLPESFIFTTSLKVRVSDLNYGGHVGNEAILLIAQEARMQFFQSLGFESETKIEGGIGTIVADAAVVYKAESFYGDELSIKIAYDEFNKYGFDLYYKISNKENEKEIARLKTGVVFFDYENRKLTALPNKVKAAIEKMTH